MPVMAGSNGVTWLGGRDIVWTGNKTAGGGRFVVVANGVRTNGLEIHKPVTHGKS